MLPTRRSRWRATTALLAAVALTAAACGSAEEAPETDPADGDDAAEEPADDEASGDLAGQTITVYSGRNEELVGFIFDDFTEATGIEVDVRYGDTAELAQLIAQEGDASPADVYFGQDAGALGFLQSRERLVELPADVLDAVEPAFRSREGFWTGTTGRVRVISYNTDALSEDEVPDSVFDLTDPAWSGRIGWAPTNGGFQAFVTAMRVTEGEEATRDWLEGVLANDPAVYENNTAIVEGIGRGEVDLGIPNHYYLIRFQAEDPDFPVANKYLPGDIGGLVNIAGVGVLGTSQQQEAAFAFVRYLLSEDVQSFFAQSVDALEFPVIAGVDSPELPSLDEIDPPDVDLSDLEDLEGTVTLLREVGAID